MKPTEEEPESRESPSGKKPRTKAERRRVTGRLKTALDLMIYEGQAFDVAARTANLTVRSMRRALDRPYVIAYLKAQREVFRASASAANIHRLVEMRDKSGNAMAKLGAIKVLEQIDETAPNAGNRAASPGFVVVVNVPASAEQQRLDAKPLIEQRSLAQPVPYPMGRNDEPGA